MTDTARDPTDEGERAAREGIPAEANPYQDGSQEHALWSAGHERVAGAIEAGKLRGRRLPPFSQRTNPGGDVSRMTFRWTHGQRSVDRPARDQPIFFNPLVKRGPFAA
jgi:hypothetical protein